MHVFRIVFCSLFLTAYCFCADVLEELCSLDESGTNGDPELAKMENTAGMEFAYQGVYGEALKHFDVAVAHDPQNPWYHFNRGIACQHVQKFAEAVDSFSKAMKYEPQKVAEFRLEYARALVFAYLDNPVGSAAEVSKEALAYIHASMGLSQNHTNAKILLNFLQSRILFTKEAMMTEDFSKIQRPAKLNERPPPPAGTCDLIFERYEPSKWETEWVNNIEEWQDHACDVINSQRAKTDKWIDAIEKWKHSSNRNEMLDPKLFSRMVYSKRCTDRESLRVDISCCEYRWVEPMVGLTRHPRSVCTNHRDQDKSHLLLDMRENDYSGSFFVFDLGAGLYSRNGTEEEVSQQWLVENYEYSGVNIDRYLAWEKDLLQPNTVFHLLPNNILHKYQWYNIAVDSDPKSAFNPLNTIRQICKENDYVVFKLDIDNNPIERMLIHQILTNEDLLLLIDEIFFEHHVTLPAMGLRWEPSLLKETLSDTYRIMTALRQAGVRMHNWP